MRFLGRVTAAELPQYFALCDVFVTPSRPEPPSVEGFGLVFLDWKRMPVANRSSGRETDRPLESVERLHVGPGPPQGWNIHIVFQ